MSQATSISASPRTHRLWRILKGTAADFFDPDTSLRCAGCAFFSFLSLFPAIGILAFVYGLVADRATLADTIDALRYVLPSAVLKLLREQLAILIAQPPASLSVGLAISIVLAIWSGSRGINALIFAMSRVRHEPEKRNFITAALVSIGLTLGGSIFLVVALLTVAGLPALIPFPEGGDWVVLVVRWPVLLALAVVVLSILYRWGPDPHPRKFRYIWPGAALASLLWILAGVIFSIYVENFSSYQATFGSITAAVVLLLWIYNSAQVLVLGAAFNSELEKTAGR